MIVMTLIMAVTNKNTSSSSAVLLNCHCYTTFLPDTLPVVVGVEVAVAVVVVETLVVAVVVVAVVVAVVLVSSSSS